MIELIFDPFLYVRFFTFGSWFLLQVFSIFEIPAALQGFDFEEMPLGATHHISSPECSFG